MPPALALMILLAIEHSAWWLLATGGIALLFLQGVRRESDSRKMVSDAIYFGRIESSSVKKYEAWVEHELPAEINRYMSTYQRSQETRDPSMATYQ